jgi:hypothetical protein
MRLSRAYIALISMLAIAANSLAAMGTPCRCTRQVDAECPCCSSAAKQAVATKLDRPACCARQQSPSNAVLQTPAKCCCGQTPPASVTARESSPKSSAELAIKVACWSADRDDLSPTSGILRHSPGRFALSGPPLLALYCIWLK